MNTTEITASKLERLWLCHGSLVAERGLPDRPSPISREGERIHEMLAGYFRGKVLDEDSEALSTETLTHQYINEANHLIGAYTNGESYGTFVEERLDCIDGYSGKPDLVVTWETADRVGGWEDQVQKCALILDWKCGWIEQEASQSNLQLRAYAVLVGLNHGCSKVFVALLQRHAQTVVTEYNVEDLIRAREEIRAIIRNASAPGATRTAGERQCRYCKAVGICPEAREAISETLAVVDPHVDSLPLDAAPETVELLVHFLDGKELAYIRERKKIAEMVFTLTDEEIRRRLQVDPNAVPGWALKPGNKVRTITNAQQAFKLLNGLIDPKTFASCCTVAIGPLEHAFRDAHGSTVAQSKQALTERLASVIEEKQNNPSIVRAK